jgi:hypothetical protein
MCLLEDRDEPLQSLNHPLSSQRTACLDVPVVFTNRVEREFLRDFCGVHRGGEILLVGKNEESCPLQILGRERGREREREKEKE